MFNQADPTFGHLCQTVDTRMKQLTPGELVGLFQKVPTQRMTVWMEDVFDVNSANDLTKPCVFL